MAISDYLDSVCQVLSDDIISRNDGWKFQRLDRIMILYVENFLSLCIFSTILTVWVNSCASDLKWTCNCLLISVRETTTRGIICVAAFELFQFTLIKECIWERCKVMLYLEVSREFPNRGSAGGVLKWNFSQMKVLEDHLLLRVVFHCESFF